MLFPETSNYPTPKSPPQSLLHIRSTIHWEQHRTIQILPTITRNSFFLQSIPSIKMQFKQPVLVSLAGIFRVNAVVLLAAEEANVAISIELLLNPTPITTPLEA